MPPRVPLPDQRLLGLDGVHHIVVDEGHHPLAVPFGVGVDEVLGAVAVLEQAVEREGDRRREPETSADSDEGQSQHEHRKPSQIGLSFDLAHHRLWNRARHALLPAPHVVVPQDARRRKRRTPVIAHSFPARSPWFEPDEHRQLVLGRSDDGEKIRAVTSRTDWLELVWWTDGDGTGRVECSVAVGGWAGRSEAWFGRPDLLSFARGLREFPIPDREGAHLSGGYTTGPNWEEDVTTVAVQVVPVGHRGQVGIEVRLRPWDPGPPLHPRSIVHVRLPCTYPALERFAGDIEAMVGPDVLDPGVGHFEGRARIDGEALG